MSNTTYYQIKRDVILNRAKYYYENDKKRLRGQAWDKYRNLSEEDENKKREYGPEIYLQRNFVKKISFHCIKHGTRSSVFWRKWYH